MTVEENINYIIASVPVGVRSELDSSIFRGEAKEMVLVTQYSDQRVTWGGGLTQEGCLGRRG